MWNDTPSTARTVVVPKPNGPLRTKKMLLEIVELEQRAHAAASLGA
jgi:hypothetical protein